MYNELKVTVERLTLEFDGKWGINYTKRLLAFVEIIGEQMEYDEDVI